MIRHIISFLICALHGLLIETAPVGADNWKKRADLADAAVIPEQGRIESLDDTNSTSLILATITRTITSRVTHTIDSYPSSSFSPALGSSPSLRLITAAAPSLTNDIIRTAGNHSHTIWDVGKQHPAGIARITFLYVVLFMMCISLLYLMAHILWNLSRIKKLRRWCCTPRKEDNLREIELEESAGVSWTEGSNLTTPHPEIRAPDWPGTWAEMVAVGGADAFGSTGRARLSSASPSIRRNRRNGIERAVPRDCV